MDISRAIITIGRQTGSCGVEIGQTIAQRLGIKCYDRELLTMAAKESGYTPQLFERHDEKPANSLIYSMAMGAYPYGPGAYGATEMPLDHKLFLAQFDTIRKIAEKESCVIVGRCADYILRARADCLTVFIHADPDKRAERAVQEYGDREESVQKRLKEKDKRRAAYYQFYTDMKWGEARNYHVCLDSGELGIEKCAEIIEQLY